MSAVKRTECCMLISENGYKKNEMQNDRLRRIRCYFISCIIVRILSKALTQFLGLLGRCSSLVVKILGY